MQAFYGQRIFNYLILYNLFKDNIITMISHRYMVDMNTLEDDNIFLARINENNNTSQYGNK